MFCRKEDYLKVKKNHQKTLKIVYNSNECYEELLISNNEVSIHQKQLCPLTTEIYKSFTDVNPDFMKNYFSTKKIPYSLRNGSVLKIPSTGSTHYGTNSVHFRAYVLQNKLPNLFKKSQSLPEFKYMIKTIEKLTAFAQSADHGDQQLGFVFISLGYFCINYVCKLCTSGEDIFINSS